MLIPFNTLKVTQASAVLLKTEPEQRMSRLRLLKLLYIADREALRLRGRPITGDRPVAMENGPVLSKTYDLIKGRAMDSASWSQFFRNSHNDVILVQDPGVGKLSKFEIAKLQEVAEQRSKLDDWGIADETHKFQEWIKNKPDGRTSRDISVDDLLAATGRTGDKDRIIEIDKAESAFDRLITGHA